MVPLYERGANWCSMLRLNSHMTSNFLCSEEGSIIVLWNKLTDFFYISQHFETFLILRSDTVVLHSVVWVSNEKLLLKERSACDATSCLFVLEVAWHLLVRRGEQRWMAEQSRSLETLLRCLCWDCLDCREGAGEGIWMRLKWGTAARIGTEIKNFRYSTHVQLLRKKEIHWWWCIQQFVPQVWRLFYTVVACYRHKRNPSTDQSVWSVFVDF